MAEKALTRRDFLRLGLLLPAAGPLHLARHRDLLDLAVPPPDLTVYDRDDPTDDAAPTPIPAS